ncbi:MAG: serine hydrolase domain-containing protein [Pseudomonadota bacterium]
MRTKSIYALLVLSLVGCGGSSGGGTVETPVPIPEPPTADAWAEVDTALDEYAVENLALIVGNESGEVYAYEKGSFDVEASYSIASASKWLTGATILTLVEQGILRLDDQPQNYLNYWTDDPLDPSSTITLEQLLSFTAGFHRSPGAPGCIGSENIELQDCVAEWYEIGVDATPGTTYHYGPVHMQVAAAMAEVATGQRWSEIVQLTIAAPLALDATGFAGINPRASGAADSSARNYARFLQAHLTGELLAGTLDELVTERTTSVTISSEPAAISNTGVDWQYGLGVWRECDEPTWNAACDSITVISSAGAFGWYPWLDLDNGYYAVLAMEEPVTLLSSPSAESVQLGAVLKPLILEALGD